jgi:hypothetical protein
MSGFYCIVNIGESPELDCRLNADLGATCKEWSQLPDTVQMEVVEIDLGGDVSRRYSSAESKKIVRSFQHPKTRSCGNQT